MARREPDPVHDNDPLKGGLKHNPFAGLKGGAGDAPSAATPPSHKAEHKAEKKRVVHERITVRLERAGRGGKAVTIAEGPGFTGRKLDGLAKEIARGLGLGARVEGSTLVVQGDQRERLRDWLSAHGFASVALGN